MNLFRHSHHPPLPHSFIPSLRTPFSANPSHHNRVSSSRLTARIPRTFHWYSWAYLFLRFSFFSFFQLFSVWFRAVDWPDLCQFRSHVKIASCIIQRLSSYLMADYGLLNATITSQHTCICFSFQFFISFVFFGSARWIRYDFATDSWRSVSFWVRIGSYHGEWRWVHWCLLYDFYVSNAMTGHPPRTSAIRKLPALPPARATV